MKAKYGFYHCFSYTDFDGTNAEAEWIEAKPHPKDEAPLAGWWAPCVCEPEAGLIGPFTTKAEAVKVAVNEAAFCHWLNSRYPTD